MKLRILLYLAFAAAARAQCPGGYTAQRSITVNSAQVAGTLSNFTWTIVNPTSGASNPNNLKTVGNGGRVTDANGYDITFYTAGGSLLPFELVGHGGSSTTYAAASGNAEFHVQVGSTAVGTAIYLCYGNAAITTYQGNDNGAWNSSYKGVWHVPNGSTLGLSDSSSSAITLTNHTATATAGQVDGSVASTATAWLSGDDSAISFGAGAFSVSGWFNTTSVADSFVLNWGNGGVAQIYVGIYDAGSGHKAAIVGNGFANVTDSIDINDGNWHLITATNDGSVSGNTRLYVDGSFKSGDPLVWAVVSGGSSAFTIGRASNGTATFTGSSDEITISNVLHSDAWVAAEFNNQSAPGIFYAVGSETNPSAGTFTVSPIALPLSNAADIVVSLTGSGTAWDGTTVITATGVSGTSCGSVNVTSGTAATVICTTGATSGTLTLTESVTGSAVATVPVSSGGGTHAFVGSGG